MNSKSENCRVCGEKRRVGWHCGSVTCEACKKFFLRNVETESEQMKCVYSNNQCVITKSTRTNCSSCRFQKCLKVGMQKKNEKAKNQSVSFKEIECVICGDASSGLHFGCITCEGCKGFFRRSSKEQSNFTCSLSGKCEISVKTRNQCRACRLQKCIDSGMDLKNSKIGRQTNLFKQKLKFPTGDNGQPAYKSKSNEAAAESEDELYDFEDYLEPNEIIIVKTADFSFSQIFESKNKVDSKFFLLLNNLFKFANEWNSAFKFFSDYGEKCAAFLTDILPKFKGWPKDIQMKVLANTIHGIRLAQLSFSSKNENYFDCDEQMYASICANCFPFFTEVIQFLQPTFEFVRGLNLDSKERALFTAYVALLTAARGLLGPEYCALSSDVSQALIVYMQQRRNEFDSCNSLFNNSFRIGNMNIKIESEIYKPLKELEALGLRQNNFCHDILYASFETSNE